MTLAEMVVVVGGTATTMLALYALDSWWREHAGTATVKNTFEVPRMLNA